MLLVRCELLFVVRRVSLVFGCLLSVACRLILLYGVNCLLCVACIFGCLLCVAC